MTEPVEIFTDGACRGNPGPGGWGVLLSWKDHKKSLYGGERQTTNNRMELLAAIRGLEALKQPCDVVVTTDSRYVLDGVTRWLVNWKARQWQTASKQPVKNIDLWQRLDAALGRHRQVEWRWVKGHSGHPQNEAADRLANQAIDELRDDDPQGERPTR